MGMTFWGNERGLSEVLGAILVFALVLAVLVLIQMSAVPAANKQIEFEHNQVVQGDMQGLAQAVDRAGYTASSESASVEAGVRYPPRLFLINPPPSSGALRTTDSTVTLSNVEAINLETRDYLDGLDKGFDTTSIGYEPNYNRYENPPVTTYEHGIVLNEFEREADRLVVDPGRLVNGRRISLVFLEGDLATTQVQSVPLDVSPVSAPAQAIAVQGQGGNAITISLKSDLSVEEWQNQVLAEEIDTDPNGTGTVDDATGRYVDRIHCDSGGPITDPCSGNIVITMEEGVTYDLRMAKVAIDSSSDPVTAEYVTKIGAEKPTILPDGTELAIEVRDAFNNPISGQEVVFDRQAGKGNLSTTTATTDESGRASTVYMPVGNDTVTVYAGIDNDDDGKITDLDGAKNIVKYEGLTVGEGQLNTGQEFEINSRAPNSVVLNYAVLTKDTCNSASECSVKVNFTNTHATSGRTIERMRINYFGPNSISFGNRQGAPELVTVSGNTGSETLAVQGEYKNVTVATWNSGGSGNLTFTFKELDGNNLLNYSATTGDYFVATIAYTDGSSNIYFIAPITPTELDALNSLDDPVAAQLSITQVTGNKYELDASGSTGVVVEYRWDVENDGTVDAITMTPTYMHESPGGAPIEASVTIVGYNGSTDSATASYP
jgi:hypothetical protein